MSKIEKKVLEDTFKTVGDLYKSLNEKGTSHNNFHHYTDLISLRKILSGKSLLLSRLDTMNDQQELRKIITSNNEWQKVYSACFTYGISENMGLWGLYSIPNKIGVRISFKKSEMKKILEKNKVISAFPNFRSHQANAIQLTDVLYVSNEDNDKTYKFKYYYSETPYYSNMYVGDRNSKYGDNGVLIGALKNEAWSYEKEVRLNVKVSNEIYSEKIMITLEDVEFENVTVTFAPWVSNVEKESFRRFLDGLEGGISSIKTASSEFTDLVTYKTHCDICSKKPFEHKDEFGLFN
jgi:hypothetical protein